MELKTERLLIRGLFKTDLPFLIKTDQDERVISFERDTVPGVKEIKEKYKDIRRRQKDDPRFSYYFIVTKLSDGTPVGKIHLRILNAYIDDWEIGWTFHPDYWGNGYAAESARKVVEFAISELHVHRVTAFCLVENTKSENVMNRIGMKKEGCIRKSRLLNGMWHDEYIYSFLSGD